MMKKLLGICKAEAFARLLFNLIYMAAVAALPYIIKIMIDCKYERGITDVVYLSAIFLGFIVLETFAQYISQLSAWKLTVKLLKTLRSKYFATIIKKGPKDFFSKTAGEYNSVIINDISACDEYMEYVMQIAEGITGFVVYAVYIFLLDVRLAIIIYAVAAAALFLPKITGKTFSAKKNTLLNNTGKYTSKVLDLLGGYHLVNSVTYKEIVCKHDDSLSTMEDSRYQYGSFKTFVNILNGSVMYIINAGAFVSIAVFLMQGRITVGIATATIAYIQDFMFPLRTIIDASSGAKSVRGTVERLFNEVDFSKESGFGRAPEPFEKMELSHVTAGYDKEVIHDFSYTFEKGKKYVITGDSGSGKSTLLKVLSGVLTPISGETQINSKSVTYDMARERLFFLTQDEHIFEDGFEDNVTVYGSYRLKNNLQNAINPAKYLFLSKSKDCSKLSGGEKQLIGLLRALNAQYDVMLLDEPFASLDFEAEKYITEQLLKSDATIIMVTHTEDKEYLDMFDEIIRVAG